VVNLYKQKTQTHSKEDKTVDIIQMSKKEVNQITIFEKLKRKEISQIEASRLLRLSTRQIRRKQKKYLKEGSIGLIHKGRGRASNRKTPEKKRSKIVNLYKVKYSDFGPTFASEKLRENHSIEINPETLRIILIEEKLWRIKRKRSKHYKWRPRKEHFGEMTQLDGSYHDWFEGRNEKCCLLAYVDDATSRVWCKFAKRESCESIFMATKEYCLQHGKPLSFYADRGSVFKVNLNNPDEKLKTQFERGLEELDIKVIHARSPQAKGRVERFYKTVQDRLVKEMRLRNISNIKDANNFLEKEFIYKHNKKYAKDPLNKNSFFRETSSGELEKALCLKEQRTLRNDFTIRYKNKILQLTKQQKTPLFPKDKILIFEHLEEKLELYIRKTKLFFEYVSQETIKNKNTYRKENHVKERKVWVPPKNHPWRKSNSLFFR